MQGAPAERLVRHAPLHLRHGPPPLPDLAAARRDRLDAARGARPDLPLPRARPRHRRRRPDARARQLHGRDRPGRRRQDDAPARAARPPARGRRRDPLERPAVDDPATFLVPPRAAYTPQVPRLFSESLRDNILMGLPDRDGRLERAIRGRCWSATCRRWSTGSRRWSGRAASSSPAGRSSAPPPRACSPASPTCWSSTTSRARSTSRPSWRSGPASPAGSTALRHAHRSVTARVLLTSPAL